jgi:hypothetical protein
MLAAISGASSIAISWASLISTISGDLSGWRRRRAEQQRQ